MKNKASLTVLCAVIFLTKNNFQAEKEKNYVKQILTAVECNRNVNYVRPQREEVSFNKKNYF